MTAAAAFGLASLSLFGSAVSPKTVALYTSEVCVGHNPGRGHPERPARLKQLIKALRNEWVPEFGDRLQLCEPLVDVTDEQLLRVHTKEHVDRVSAAFTTSESPLNLQRRSKIDSDTIASPGTRKAARRGAGLVVAAVDDVFAKQPKARDPVTAGSRNRAPKYTKPKARDAEVVTKVKSPSKKRIRRAFVMVRPPGHHAESDRPMGFCMYNNVMVGVAHAQAEHGVRRIAILDFDVHYGNGDAAIAEMVGQSCLYVSSHETPSYPFSGEFQGRIGAFRNVVNAPLPAAAGSAEFRRAWRERLLPAVRNFRPQAIFLSAGFDAHGDDPLSSTELTDDDFHWLTSEVAALGGGNLPIISVLEGGYNVERLPQSVRSHVAALIET